jgi:HAD superfamily hydrolase (TIGR01509 family)
MYKVILFDLDDTLIYFDDYWEESVKETFCQHVATMGLECNSLFEVYKEKDLFLEQKYLKQEISIQQYRNYRIMESLNHFEISISYETANDFEEMYRTISKTKMKARPQVLRTLEALSEKYSLGIVTNGTADWQHDKIDALGIKHLFGDKAILISEQIGVEKPSPGIYRKALEYFRVPPQEVLFVGDSWQNDVLGPHQEGIHTIWLNRKDKPIPTGANPTSIIREMEKLIGLLL